MEKMNDDCIVITQERDFEDEENLRKMEYIPKMIPQLRINSNMSNKLNAFLTEKFKLREVRHKLMEITNGFQIFR